MKEVFDKSGQIWVETVIYTLIALALIGVVLSFVKPKIEEFKDHATIEKTINFLNEVDNTIEEIHQEGAGNKRIINFKLSGGSLVINGETDTITFEMESIYKYSEIGESYSDNNFQILTEKKGSKNLITITKKYNYNLTYDGGDISKRISQSSNYYKITLLNKGFINDKPVIDVVIS